MSRSDPDPDHPGPGTAASRRRAQGGAASVESAGLAALIALLVIAVVAAVGAGGEIEGGRELGAAIGRRIACGPRLPDACHHHPLVPAYGWPLARLVRALAPPPSSLRGPDGQPLMPVDFRYCRRPSCAVAAGPHVTASNRRTTAFTQLLEDGGVGGEVEIVFWLYRPSIGWEAIRRRVDEGDVEAASGTEVLASDDPALVPLETLPGANQYDFPAGEEPPWRWQIERRYPGWSS